MTRYAGIDFVNVVEQKACINLVRRSNHKDFGDEFWGPCPFCKGGENRFHVWPQGSRPHYWCRVCLREGSPAQFLMEYCNMSFGEALEELGLPDSDEEHEYVPPTLNEQLARGAPPSKKWQESAHLIIERATSYLWHPKSPEGQQALAYLRRRGLTDETIKRAKLGYVPLGKDGRWYVGDFEKWGINPDELREDQRAKGGVRIPDGILIPWTEGSTIWKLCLKRPGQIMSYGQVMGSSDGGLYGIDSVTADMPCMMVESEICALSVQQEAGDICNAVATGSTPKGRNSRLASDLVAASCILQSFDVDEAGDEAAEYWIGRFKDKAMRWRPWADEWSEQLRFKDPNEMLQNQDEFKAFAGYTLRGWVEQGIQIAQLPAPDKTPTPEPPEDPNKPGYLTILPTDDTTSEQAEKAKFDEVDRLEQFADIVSQIAREFGDAVITKAVPGQTIEERARELRSSYAPVTLPALPRKICPHTGCIETPLQGGWCKEHVRSGQLLELGATLGYPEVELSFQASYGQTASRTIGAGVVGWEAYAEIAPERWLVRDMARIREKFGLLRLIS
jgi:hypothetical protein